MPTVTIDDREYDLDSLSDEAKGQIVAMQAVDKKLGETRETLAILQTARNAYLAALKSLLPD